MHAWVSRPADISQRPDRQNRAGRQAGNRRQYRRKRAVCKNHCFGGRETVVRQRFSPTYSVLSADPPPCLDFDPHRSESTRSVKLSPPYQDSRTGCGRGRASRWPCRPHREKLSNHLAQAQAEAEAQAQATSPTKVPEKKTIHF